MAREAAGTVFVQIDGDNSPLLAKFAQTEAIAKAAGTRIATGMGSGFQSATGIVGQFGVAVSSGVTEPLEEVVPAAEAAAASVQRVGVAAEGTVPEIAAASGAIRVFEGNMPIRAVERFATSILGLGPLLQAAFPLVGAIALIEMVSHVVGKFGELSEEEKKAADSAKQLNAEWDQLAVKFESGMVERATLEMGRLAGLKLAGFYEESTANRDRARLQAITEQAATARKQMAQDAAAASLSSNPLVAGAQALNPTVTISRYLANVDWKAQAAKVKPLEDEIGTLTEKLKIYDEVTKNVNLDQQKKQAAEDAKRIRNAAIAEVKSESELLKSAFDEELADARSNHLVSVGEEKSFWQNRLEVVDQWGGRYSELHRKISQTIGTLNQEDIKQQQEADKKKLDAQLKDLEMTGSMMDAQIRLNAENQREAEAQAQRNINLTRRVNEVAIKGEASTVEGDNAVAKLRVQQQYALQIVHTKQQELQYAQEMAGFDEKALQIKKGIADLQLTQAILENSITPTREGQLKIAEDQLQVMDAQEAIEKQRVADETKIAELMQKQSLAGQVQNAVGKGPATFADAKNIVIANSVGSAVNGIANAFGSAVQGGEKFSKIMSQLGRQILGEVVQGIVKIGLQMAVTALTGKALGSAIAVAEVTSAAAVGAANAAAATAAIPIIGPALAPGVAATTFAEIMAFAPLASYDKGGPIFDDQIAKIHKGEFILTADQMSGRAAMPSLPVRGSVQGGLPTASALSSSRSMSIGAIHVHGVRDARDLARRLPDVLKAVSPVFSPSTS